MSGSLILGFFDGIHTAHRAVIDSAINYSKNQTTLITFKESPAVYFGKEKEYILTRTESINRIKKLGVDNVEEFDFPKIASMSAGDYLEFITEKYSPEAIFTGFNHTFGLNKIGNPEFLEDNQKNYGYKYFCIPPCKKNDEIISSTLIKKYLKDGRIEAANELLEEEFILEGTVIKGAQIGRKIGFPTANINYPSSVVKIPFGVYKVLYEGMPAILNWGMRPTVHNITEPVAEIHILDFEGDLYGKNIKVKLLKQIRAEKQFGNLDELKSQIEKDIKECLK